MRKVRVAFCGEQSVGKTTIINRFASDQFDPSKETQETVVVNCISKEVKTPEGTVHLQLWDTAGTERYRSVINNFFHKANAIVIVYDVSVRSSFEQLPYWYEFSKENNTDEAEVFIVGNKKDLQEQVSISEGYDFSKEYGAKFFITSAKTGENIRELFERLALVSNESTPFSTDENLLANQTSDSSVCC
ncbi:ras-related protein Rab-41 isoform X3 [Histomonas meleagridis]|uniref:ras-related protein Rab-41 isoform X3 n=1 Tax=Histomonas meleagridis TaxID=135588 RepID=UPI00355AB71E|nr:ras-related protein Rab-41 isoform X3 [Histomonas meleagridis]KAH0798346.1 ras-related protein Rab-41 isoform X3 [Histomonas meleagridis]